jgi:hypothetical protein
VNGSNAEARSAKVLPIKGSRADTNFTAPVAAVTSYSRGTTPPSHTSTSASSRRAANGLVQ